LPLALLAGGMSSGCVFGPPPHVALSRCIWVDRWDYGSADDIDRLIGECQRAGFSAVMFQVRGNGTVLYPSAFEVWSERFDYRDPGFDPLAVAVAAAHSRGLELHAWVNVMPGWRGAEPPANRAQLWHKRRDWFLEERLGGASSYVNLNPCLPEVRRYLCDVCAEIATRYDVDGVHLDYVRFPDPTPGSPEGFGYDPLTLMLFSRATGRATSDHAALRRWHADCVTQLVVEIGDAVGAVAEELPVTAAVIASPSTARQRVRQDWAAWCRRDLVDAVFPMNYTADDAQFELRVDEALRAAVGVPVIMGVGVYKHRTGVQSRRQLEAAVRAGAAGISVFSYRAMFGDSPEVRAAEQGDLRREVGKWIETTARRR